MKFNKYLICALFLVLICCIGAASAAETSADAVAADDAIDEAVSETVDVSDEIDEEPLGVSEEPALSDGETSSSSEKVIYVGTNGTGGGDGLPENPFTTLDSACNSVEEYKDKIIVNVYEGNYTIGSLLTFKTSNLHINGMNGKVIFKNLYDDEVAKQSFALTGSGNFTMSNIIIDASGYTQCNYDWWFAPIIGDDNTIIFNNCTFTGYDGDVSILADDWYLNNNKCIFNECKFIDFTNERYLSYGETSTFEFNYCVFSATFKEGIGIEETEAIFNKCWFGANDLEDTLMFYGVNKYGKYPRAGISDGRFKFTKNAIFDISENYLGDNKFEIIGKLMWNDSTTDDIDKLGVMTVSLNSDTGILNQTTAILENGIFKVSYTSTSSNNNISAVLDNQQIDLIFTNMDMSLNAPIISYGEDQNITVTLPQVVYGTVTVLVDGIPYTANIENDNSIVIPITDTLSAGSHNVNVTFIDEENHIYAFNTTTITVNKVSNYDFDATITPNTVYIGENATVTLNLPDGATGNVTIKVGDNEAKTFNINDIISINGFVVGENTVNITFNSDNYEAKTVVKTVVAYAKPTNLAASDVTTTYNVTKELVITLTSNGDVLANKMINVVVGSINKTLATNASGQVSIDISSLAPDTYTANIAFAGDDVYNKSSTTAKVTVKEEIKTNITLPEIVAGKATTTTIILPQNATGNVTVIVDGNVTSVVNLTNGSATVTIPELPAGKHNVTISYSGDDNYVGFAQTSAVEVKEPAKPTPKPDDQKPATVKKTATKITAKKKTFKAKTKVKKYTITLKAVKKAVKKVQVILKIGKKTYKAKTNAKGKATFKIKKLTKKGKYAAKITFKGNKLYKATTKKVKITVKK